MIFIAQSALAQAVDFLLGDGFGKTAGVNPKLALQPNFFQKWRFSRGEGDFGLEADDTRHRSLR